MARGDLKCRLDEAGALKIVRSDLRIAASVRLVAMRYTFDGCEQMARRRHQDAFKGRLVVSRAVC